MEHFFYITKENSRWLQMNGITLKIIKDNHEFMNAVSSNEKNGKIIK